MSGAEKAPNPCSYLLNVLEHARTRFAVAVAVESKTTPVDQWNQYLRTEDQLRCIVKKLRVLRRLGTNGDSKWNELAESVGRTQNLPPATHSEAQLLCEQLRAVMEKINEYMSSQDETKGFGRLVSEGEK
jgi:hypothetical protein